MRKGGREEEREREREKDGSRGELEIIERMREGKRRVEVIRCV